MSLAVEALTGPGLTGVLADLARLRIAVFRDWPYLYDGSLDYERGYLESFAAAADTVIVVAADAGRIVGASTGSPMTGHAEEFAAAFRAQGRATAPVFYFGESVLLPEYRGRGLGHAFFDHREAHARRLGRFTHTAFCAVQRPADHPARPAGYRPLDAFWRKRGYAPVPGLVATFRWKDIDRDEADGKPMQFWQRDL